MSVKIQVNGFTVRMRSVRFETEYRIRTAVSGEERRELSEDISGRGYVSVRGPECKIYGEKLAEIFEVVRVEK